MKLNSSEDAERRFICIQLPEKTDAKSDAKIRGFNDLAEIGRRRLEVAAIELGAAQHSLLNYEPRNIGFRTFRLDTSNIRAWAPQPQALAQSLFDHLDHIHPDRSDEDLLYELLLKLGLDLCVPIEQKLIADKMVFSIGGGVLMACLEREITTDDAEPLALGLVAWRDQQAPAGDVTCVFRDSAFQNDVAKANLAAILEQHGIGRVRSL